MNRPTSIYLTILTLVLYLQFILMSESKVLRHNEHHSLDIITSSFDNRSVKAENLKKVRKEIEDQPHRKLQKTAKTKKSRILHSSEKITKKSKKFKSKKSSSSTDDVIINEPLHAPTTTAYPTMTPSSAPSLPFDLGDCKTYDYYWKKDMYRSCGEKWETCECTAAQRRIDSGEINCETAQCPTGCEVCIYCLMEVIDCVGGGSSGSINTE